MKNKRKDSIEHIEGENRKIKIVPIDCISRDQCFAKFHAKIICPKYDQMRKKRKTEKKSHQKRTPDNEEEELSVEGFPIQIFYGEIPTTSLMFEYEVTVDNKNRILLIHSWKRTGWWITKKDIIDMMGCVKSKSPKWRFEDIREVSLQIPDAYILSSESDITKIPHMLYSSLEGHFHPDLWFDLFCLNVDDSPVFEKRLLEDHREEICMWQEEINVDLIKGLFERRIENINLTWQHIEILVERWKKRRSCPRLSTRDLAIRHRFKSLHGVNELAKMIRAKEFSLENIRLIEPKIASHNFQIDTNRWGKAFTNIETIRSKMTLEGDNSCELIVPNEERQDLLTIGLVIEIENNRWNTLENYNGCKSLYRLIKHLETNMNRSKICDLKEALDREICVIVTKGYNESNVIHRLIETHEERVCFLSPDHGCASKIFSMNDINIWPNVTSKYRIDPPKVLVFCFSHLFSYDTFDRSLQYALSNRSIETIEKIVFIGDPLMSDLRGYSGPLMDLIDDSMIPKFVLRWEDNDSLFMNHFEINNLTRDLLSIGNRMTYRHVSWKDGIIDHLEEKDLIPLYQSLLKSNDPMSYHILCDSKEKTLHLEKEMRSKHPTGFVSNDKYFDPKTDRIDAIKRVFTFNDEYTMEENPKGTVYANRKNHSIVPFIGDGNVHDQCCFKKFNQNDGKFKLINHPIRWANVQTFSENRMTMVDHLLIIVTKNIDMRHLYSASCMAMKRLTIIGSIQNIDHMLSKRNETKHHSILSHFRSNVQS